MSWSQLSHETAAKYARRAQWAFGLVGACAVAVAAFGTRPEPVPALPPLEVHAPVVPSGEGPDAERGISFDAKAIASRLELVGNRPKLVPKVDEPQSEAPPEMSGSTDSLRFLGVLREPGRLVALLKIGDKQKFLGAGETAGNVKVLEITDSTAVVTEGGVEKKLELRDRQGSAVTYIAGSASSPGHQPGAPRPMGGVTPNNAIPDASTILERRERARREAAEAQTAMEGEVRTGRPPKPMSGDKH